MIDGDSDAFIFALYPFLFSAVAGAALISAMALYRTRGDSSRSISLWWFMVGTFVAQAGDVLDELRVLTNRLVMHAVLPSSLRFLYSYDPVVIAGKGLKALGAFIAATIIWAILTNRPPVCLRHVIGTGLLFFALAYPVLAYLITLLGG